jgi:N-acetylmuramoyl-L-alanine amidase
MALGGCPVIQVAVPGSAEAGPGEERCRECAPPSFARLGDSPEVGFCRRPVLASACGASAGPTPVHDGARIVMTRASNDGVGPCVNTRAQIINDAHVNVAVDIHADGGPPSGRGFAILEPVADGPNDEVITSSERFGAYVGQAFVSGTSMPESTYDGVGGIADRNNLAGLNLTTVPEVLIECGNMRNATDAALLTTTAFQERVARALEAAIIRFLS